MKTRKDNVSSNDVITDEARGDFEIGQAYEDMACVTLVCKKCGTDRFIVGVGSCFTAIKCPACKYEVSIHEG